MAQSNPYVIASLISAIPATLGATAAWYSAHRNGKQGHRDTDKVIHQVEQVSEKLVQIDTRFERIDTNFARLDLRLDSIEDKVERHLGWHRAEAEVHLPQMLSKEATDVRPNGQSNT
jgi:hypothetical protein